jgi:hypothetical protein
MSPIVRGHPCPGRRGQERPSGSETGGNSLAVNLAVNSRGVPLVLGAVAIGCAVRRAPTHRSALRDSRFPRSRVEMLRSGSCWPGIGRPMTRAAVDPSGTQGRPTRCPNCGHNPVAAILYGLPAFSEKLQRDLDSWVALYPVTIHPGPAQVAVRCAPRLHRRHRLCHA